MKSKLPPLRFVCVSGFWDKHLWETELHQMTFQKLGHFHHLTPFSDFHEQYLKNNPKNWKQLISIPPNISLVHMENSWIITVRWVIWQNQRLITVMVVLIYFLWLIRKWTGLFYRTSTQILSLFFLFGLQQISIFQNKRQSNINFNSCKPPSPSQLQFPNSLTTSSLLAALGYKTLLRIFNFFKNQTTWC